MTLWVKLENSIIVKRAIHGPDFLVTQFVLRPGYVAVEHQAFVLEVSKSQNLQVLKYIAKGKDISGMKTAEWGRDV